MRGMEFKVRLNHRTFFIGLALTLSACILLACTTLICTAEAMTIKNYKEAKKIFWESVYPDGYTVYCNKKFTSFWREDINIEHVFPMAWVKNALQCGTRDDCRRNNRLFNKIEGDLHNLFPAISHLNYERQSYRFGEIKGEKRRYGKHCDFEIDKRKRVAEPRDKVRGDLARSMLYMEHQYHDVGLKLFNKQASLMLKWHNDDPPSVAEIERNDRIEEIQGNRNPFIDNPDFAKKYADKRKFKR